MKLRHFVERPDRTTLMAALTGLLLACSFPRPDLAVLAWVGLIPLLQVMERRPFKSGYVAGCLYYGIVLYWLNIVMVRYGGLPVVLSVTAYLLLVAYLALYFAVATWGACRLREKLGLSPILTLPVFWVALEFLRSIALTGFPWATLGYSQQGWLSMIQSADLFGVYGITFLLVLVNATANETLVALRTRRRPLPRAALVVTALLFVANLGYGLWRTGQPLDERPRTLQTTVVQGNIDQGVKWEPSFQRETVAIYRKLSVESGAGEKGRLIVWPESAVPFYFQEGNPLTAEVRKSAIESGSHLLLGSPAFEKGEGGVRYLNSAFLLSPGGETLGRSDKVHLVPFGEYVPLSGLLPFVNKLVAGIGDFSPGQVHPLQVAGNRIGVLVCYEAIFPELARDYVRKGSDLLVNITNDAWYGRSSAPYQHLAMVRFRAIENRIWIARAANTGISAFIAPSGTVHQATEIFTTTAVSTAVGLGAANSWYSRSGDFLPLIALILSVAWLAMTRRKLR